MQLTNNFHIAEFACKDGTWIPNELVPNVQELAKNLQIIRDYINCQYFSAKRHEARISVISGYRTPTYNKRVSKAKNSQHILAKAADIVLIDPSPDKKIHLGLDELDKSIKELITSGRIHNGGYKKYKSFIHYDIRLNPARW